MGAREGKEIVPSQTADAPHQKMGTMHIFLHLSHPWDLGSGFVGPVTHPFMTTSSDELVEAQVSEF